MEEKVNKYPPGTGIRWPLGKWELSMDGRPGRWYHNPLLSLSAAEQRAINEANGLECPGDYELLEKSLADCRDAFPVPEPGSALEQLWAQAMGDPYCVPAYVRAAATVHKERK